eukprot:scaffold552_cov526-Prasinococcus_capsulatus_cf.AAC.32
MRRPPGPPSPQGRAGCEVLHSYNSKAGIARRGTRPVPRVITASLLAGAPTRGRLSRQHGGPPQALAVRAADEAAPPSLNY